MLLLQYEWHCVHGFLLFYNMQQRLWVLMVVLMSICSAKPIDLFFIWTTKKQDFDKVMTNFFGQVEVVKWKYNRYMTIASLWCRYSTWVQLLVIVLAISTIIRYFIFKWLSVSVIVLWTRVWDVLYSSPQQVIFFHFWVVFVPLFSSTLCCMMLFWHYANQN